MSKTGPKPRPPYERMIARVVWSGDCLEFTGAANAEGYGKVGVPGMSAQFAHRISWEHHHGPIPPGMFVCHHCDNPPCVRIEHLFLGTNHDNVEDMVAKGRNRLARAGRTHCINGHEYTAESVNKWDQCLPCRDDAEKRRRPARNAKRREARHLAAVGGNQ